MEDNISNFTDILDDDISVSQPISLPSSSNSELQEVLLPIQNRPPKKTGQRGNFRSIEEIDMKYRHVFDYPYFNIVQSSVLDDTLYTDKSMVVCAPTGSGKTVVFEMAIVQLLMELEDKNYSENFKIIYMAPVKALCTERLAEWYPKFNKLGLLCIEVTGDTDVEFPQLKPYSIIITTPEKWDILTRRWKDHRGLVEAIKLFLIDEVHILNDESRGPVLEAVVSRMKTIVTSTQSAHRIEKVKAQHQRANQIGTIIETKIRFIAISATVSNPEDVAAWLGTTDRPAVYYKFGDDCRPVKLRRVVEGYSCSDGTSIFKFDIILNYKLWPIIQKYHNGKPTLIFCNTRKSVVLTAETLSKEITVSFSAEQKMKLTALASTIKTKKIQSLILSGVGCHHAGLLFEERVNIEHAFRNRDLPILITTTTLAMGVNLPAHLVIIKNTQQYCNGAYQEYSISTILQMVGRAGRPQYDTEATAVIMTRLQDKARYQALVEGSEPLQSYLHKRLAENLNSEAALGTVGDVAQCVQWFNSTFLSVRAARDPWRYLGLSPAAPAQQISKKIEELCVKAMNRLASAGLITMDEASCIQSTEAGRLMSVYYLDLGTMKLIMKLEGSESLERLLWLVCESHELSDMHLRVDERRYLNALNRNNAAATIRFPMKGKINSRQMKLNCVIQAVLGCLPIPEPSLNQEAMKIMKIADRVCKCLVSYVTRPNLISKNSNFYLTILNSLILAKCISAHLWENSPYVSRQLKGIGPTFSALLASAGKVNFMLLEESHPRDLERIMNKGPPAGNILRKQISLLPKYSLNATRIDESTVELQLSLVNHALLAENMDHLTAGIGHKCFIIVGDSENDLLYFTHFKDSDLINIYDGCMTFKITRKNNNEQKIFAHCISSNFVGIDEQYQYVFNDINPFSASMVNTKPRSNLTTKCSTQQPSTISKERKRKSQNDNDITQSKEKKKRESDLLSKYKHLKHSFEKTSKEIQGNLHKADGMTNKILQNLMEPKQNQNETINKYEQANLILSDDSLQNEFEEELLFKHNDDADDKQVNDILDVIENEIKVGGKPTLDNTTYVSHKTQHNESNSNITKNIFKAKYTSETHKTLKKTNNFHFIDRLDKNQILNNESITSDGVNDDGFHNSVKLHLQQYFERASNINCDKSNIIDLIDVDNGEELITTCNMKDNVVMIKEKENSLIEFNDLDNEKQYNASNFLSKDEIISDKLDLGNNEKTFNDFDLKGESITNETETQSKMIAAVELYQYKNNDSSSSKEISLVGNKNDLKENISKTLEIKTIPCINAICSGEAIKKLQQILPIFNANKNETYVSDNKGSVDFITDHALDINNRSSKMRDTLHYTKNHHISKTNYLNTTFENNLKQRVNLTGKLKIDFDVTETVYSSCNKNEDLLKRYNLVYVDDTEQVSNKSFHENNDTKVVINSKSDVYEANVESNSNYTQIFEGPYNRQLKTHHTVDDILRKYKHIMGRYNTNFVYEETKSNHMIKENKFLSANLKPNRRKYRISDLEKLEVTLPESLIAKNEENKNNIDKENTSIINDKITENFEDFEGNLINANAINIKEETGDIEIVSPGDISEELTKSNSDIDLSEAILNPKTLLQCTLNDTTEAIIPPPPEFCDDLTNFGVNEDDTWTEYNILKSQDSPDENEDAFLDSYGVDLSPPKKIEAWTLSDNKTPCDLIFSPGVSYNMHNEFTTNKTTSNFSNSRRSKLSEYKFKRKNMFRK